MAYFSGWFTDGYLDTWFDPPVDAVPPIASGHGGVSKSRPLSTIAPRPALPPWRQIPGPAGLMLTDIRNALQDTFTRDHLWGNHVEVEFDGVNALKVRTGLGGAVKGYKIVRANADVRIWDATPPEPSQERGVHWLQASAAARVTIYFY